MQDNIWAMDNLSSDTTDVRKQRFSNFKVLKDKYIHLKFHNQKFALSEIKAKWRYSAE